LDKNIRIKNEFSNKMRGISYNCGYQWEIKLLKKRLIILI